MLESEGMVGWYVYKIVMIRVFFFGGGKCKDCMYSHQFPPANFHDRFLHGPTQVATNRTCVLVVIRAAEAPLPKRRCRSAVAEAPLRCCPNTISFCLAMDQFSSIFKELRFLFVLLCVAATFA